MPKPVSIIVFAVGLCSAALGQSAQPTTAALYRTFMIQTPLERGTAFSVDIENREYWITAKHLFTGKKTGPAGEFKQTHAVAALLAQSGEGTEGQDQHWVSQTFTVIDPGKDIDILILAPSKALLPTEASLNGNSAGVGFGADCEFLGFPYGGGWKARMEKDRMVWLPYVKHCTVSALVTDGGLKVWVLDGINNEGFSGGPVLFQTGANQEVFAVISGFHPEPLDVLPAPEPGTSNTGQIPPPPPLQGQAPKPLKQIVNANSGFIVAFDIAPAIDAIHNTPIGPKRDQK
jgi:hypothetical protein